MNRDDPYESLARELRQGAGAELRAEAEITEQETLQGRLRRRSLGDLAAEALHRGDRLTVVAPDRTLVGDPVFVGSDYLVLETTGEIADVRLDRVTLAVDRRSAGGRSSRGGSRSFKARLAEYEQTGEPVTLVAASVRLELAGRLVVVATDHVVASTVDGETVVPLGLVDLVLRPRPEW